MDARDPVAFVTTSWDDGHPLDLRVADLLDRYGFRGTFYVPVKYAAYPRLSPTGIRRLQGAGMEVGSHTVLHQRLTRLRDDDALRELEQSRDALEQIVGRRVRSFCFPEGRFSKRHLPLLRTARYELARTTIAFRTELGFEPYTMPVTFQLWPHSRQILIRHALREANLTGLSNWVRHWHGESDLVRLSGRVMNYIQTFGGVLHIWGHSWEIESRGLWTLLDNVLIRCAHHPRIQYCTNIGVLDATAPSSRFSGEAMHV